MTRVRSARSTACSPLGYTVRPPQSDTLALRVHVSSSRVKSVFLGAECDRRFDAPVDKTTTQGYTELDSYQVLARRIRCHAQRRMSRALAC